MNFPTNKSNLTHLKHVEENIFLCTFWRNSSSLNRSKVLDLFKGVSKNSAILLFGGEKQFQNSTDRMLKFRQESNFLFCLIYLM
jgi:hypothetical protein